MTREYTFFITIKKLNHNFIFGVLPMPFLLFFTVHFEIKIVRRIFKNTDIP